MKALPLALCREICSDHTELEDLMQPLMAAINIIVQRMVLWIVDGGDEQDKNVKWLNCQQQGQHHVHYSTTGCGGPIHKRRQLC